MLTLNDIQAVAAVAETGSIALAAKRLHRVPSAISNRIILMEKLYGVKLFTRDRKRMVPTEKGLMVSREGRNILSAAENLENRLCSDEPMGRLRLGALESIAGTQLPRPLARLIAEYPKIHLDLTTGISRSLTEGLFANELDAILVVDAPQDPRLERCFIFEEELEFVAAKNHAPIRTPQDLADDVILAFKDGCSYRGRMLRWFESFRMQPSRIAEMSSYHAILGAIAAGMGVGIVPRSMLERFPDRDLLSEHPIEGPIGRAGMELLWRAGMMSPNIRALREILTNPEAGSSSSSSG
jgi:DNA-binding transcriptional LysR family regulator